jgi:hypothetical protein
MFLDSPTTHIIFSRIDKHVESKSNKVRMKDLVYLQLLMGLVALDLLREMTHTSNL